MINEVFLPQLPVLIELLKKYKIKTAFLFGSVVTSRFNSKSDIDLLVSFKDNVKPIEEGKLFWNLWTEMQDLFHRDIDIVTDHTLKNPYFIKELDETKIKIYG